MLVPEALRRRMQQLISDENGMRSGGTYRPAHVNYVMIFAPVLSEHLDAEDPTRLVEQILFYTSIERTVAQVNMVRQVALANALVDFASSMHRQQQCDGADLRRLAVASVARRLYLVEVLPDLWIHAVRALSIHSDSVYIAGAVEVAWGKPTAAPVACRRLGPAATAGCMERMAGSSAAIHAYPQLQNGIANDILHNQGRAALEQRLEMYFSKWVWQWDVEHQYAPTLRASQPTGMPPGIAAETLPCTLTACLADHSAGRVQRRVARRCRRGTRMVRSANRRTRAAM